MALEIERKFLLANDSWQHNTTRTLYRQGYLSSSKERTVRVRVAGDSGFLTIKGIGTGITRTEFEYPIPLADATAMLDTMAEGPLIEKYRSIVIFEGYTWEIDEFLGDNAGLIVAEIELEHEDQSFAKPHWIGEEVTGNPRYFNSNLAHNPYKKW